MRGQYIEKEPGQPMTIVHDESTGFVIDWDWRCRLTVWTVRGPWFDRDICEHELQNQPSNEKQARRAARRWWSAEGRDQALNRMSPAVEVPENPPGT